MGHFYSFGITNGDTATPRIDDGSSPVVSLAVNIPFFGQIYHQLYVNNNGFITFDTPMSTYVPYRFPARSGIDIIAGFWTDIDDRNNGIISYRQVTSGSVLQQATSDINQYFPLIQFTARWVFMATWDRVAYYPNSGTETTFQVVLISDGTYSFVLLNYGIIAATNKVIEAGYDTRTSDHHFVIPGSFQSNITNLMYTSNVNVPGRWAFRTDSGNTGCMFNGNPVQVGYSFWSDHTCRSKCTCVSSGNLRCQTQPCGFDQVCQVSTFQYSCQTVPRRTCTIAGDPHYYTFDGRLFHFQGTCTYVLSQTCGSRAQGLAPYRVEGKNENRGNTVVAWTKLVRIIVYGEEIELVKGNTAQAKVNGSFATAPFSLHNGTVRIYQTGFSLAVSTDFGLTVAYDGYSYVTISVPYDYLNATCGLCGTFNNNPADDFLSSSGSVLSSDVNFANSWQVYSDSEPGCQPPCVGASCAVCQPQQRTLFSSISHCGILENPVGAFNVCHSRLPPSSFVESCVYDLCVGRGYQPILCQALNVYATQCQQEGLHPGQWRRQGFCEIACPANSHFEPQGTGCPATCADPQAPSHCPLPSQESCICDTGFVLSAGTCVPAAQCGCTFEGRYYSFGQTALLGADCGRRCTCQNGQMSCQAHACGPQEACRIENGERGCYPLSYNMCWVEGARRYRTFDGLTFEYPGACSLTLSKVMGQSSLRRFLVTAKKVPRGTPGVEFARILRFETSGVEISIKMGPNPIVQVGGQSISLPFRREAEGVQVYLASLSRVVVQTDFGVRMEADWPHLVRLTVPSTYNGTLGGLCGNDNGYETCFSSSGTMSLSRCLLFEEGFPPHILHLNDPNCTGTVVDGRVEFLFDNDNQSCGTSLMTNGTHFIYKNSIQGAIDSSGGVISRTKQIDLKFSCEYLLSETMSLRFGIHPLESIVRKKIPSGIGTYQVRLVPYQDPQFSHPFTGSQVDLALNQRIYIGVSVSGVDDRQFSSVLESCWATPVNDPFYSIRWNLITHECPSSDDKTVEIIQNGVSTTSQFSFMMFTFAGNTSTIFLHCQVKICLLAGNDCTARCYPGYHRRVARAVNFHDGTSISMGPLTWSQQRSDQKVRSVTDGSSVF
nr:PREDICTED: alpha-tectorin-like [Lepisosteus oculatus]